MSEIKRLLSYIVLTPNECDLIREAISDYHVVHGFVHDEAIVASLLERIPAPDPRLVTR